MAETELPWLRRALEVLDLRRDDRLLLAMPGDVEAARTAAGLCGPEGEVTVLEPRRAVAEAIADALPEADVMALEPSGGERFGSFDAVLATPLAGPLPSSSDWSSLVAANLRPGGRFAIDLPGPALLPDVLAAAPQVSDGFAERIEQTLSGPPVDELSDALSSAGLRQVQSLLGTHMLEFGSPFDLVDLLRHWIPIDDDERGALGEALAHRFQATADIETLAHRTAVAGMR